MKRDDLAAQATPDIFGTPKKRGRPKSSCSLTNRQRQQKYRQRHKAVDLGERITATVSRYAKEFDLTEDEVVRELVRFALCNRNWNQTGFPRCALRKD